MTNDVHAPAGAIPFSLADRKLGVVVGFDGSEHGTLALHYAAKAAQRRGAVLTVVNAFTIAPAVYTTLAALPDIPEEQVKQQAAREVLDHAREYLKDYPGEVSYRVEEGDAAGVLVLLCKDAQLLVVGARGRGGFLGLLLGSVASALPAHARCPTVIVPRNYQDAILEGSERFAPSHSTAPVVVGIDGSEHSRVAVLQAAEAAASRGVGLHLVMALPPLEGELLWYPELAPRVAEAMEDRKAELQQSLEAECQWVRGYYPDLEVSALVQPGDPSTVMRQQTASAQLTVVGTRGRGGLASVLLGSVSRDVLLRAEGPVMVVPDLKDDRLQNQPAATVPS